VQTLCQLAVCYNPLLTACDRWGPGRYGTRYRKLAAESSFRYEFSPLTALYTAAEAVHALE
jgi:hypothetical protein